MRLIGWQICYYACHLIVMACLVMLAGCASAPEKTPLTSDDMPDSATFRLECVQSYLLIIAVIGDPAITAYVSSPIGHCVGDRKVLFGPQVST